MTYITIFSNKKISLRFGANPYNIWKCCGIHMKIFDISNFPRVIGRGKHITTPPRCKSVIHRCWLKFLFITIVLRLMLIWKVVVGYWSIWYCDMLCELAGHFCRSWYCNVLITALIFCWKYSSATLRLSIFVNKSSLALWSVATIPVNHEKICDDGCPVICHEKSRRWISVTYCLSSGTICLSLSARGSLKKKFGLKKKSLHVFENIFVKILKSGKREANSRNDQNLCGQHIEWITLTQC